MTEHTHFDTAVVEPAMREILSKKVYGRVGNKENKISATTAGAAGAMSRLTMTAPPRPKTGGRGRKKVEKRKGKGEEKEMMMGASSLLTLARGEGGM